MSFPLPEWPQTETAGLRGRYRETPEDFEVRERAGWTPDGTGEHLLCRVEKRGLNTVDVGERLRRVLGAGAGDVSWCGAKDRHAVTEQWFSVRLPGRTRWPETAATQEALGQGRWRLLECARHQRKLRRGDHLGNLFRLRLHTQSAGADAARVRAVLAAGLPNYFGPQRFGREGSNLSRAQRWVAREARLPPRGARRGELLSAARSLLFNEVLAARMRSGALPQAMAGDVLVDHMPTGPLWGRGRSATSDAAAEVEAAALLPWADWCSALEHGGLTQARRPLWVCPRDLEVEAFDGGIALSFELPPGSFATAVIAAVGDFVDATRAPSAPSAPVAEETP